MRKRKLLSYQSGHGYQQAAYADIKRKAWERIHGLEIARCRICAGRMDVTVLERVCPWCGAEQEVRHDKGDD